MTPIVTYDVFHLAYWDWRIAMDLFLGGVGVGAFVFAVLVSWWFKDEHPEISKVGATIAPVAVGLGLLFLLSEIGHPFRFYKALFSWHPTAPLWWGAWLQPVFLVISGRYAYLWHKNDHAKVAERKKIGWCGVPIALLVGSYHGFLLTMIKARPLWNAEPTTVIAILGFAITGIATVVLVLSLFEPQSVMRSIRVARDILGALILVQLFTITSWLVTLNFGSEVSRQAFLELNEHYGFAFWGLSILVGLVFPFLVGVWTVLKNPPEERLFRRTRIITSVMILIGGFFLRYCLVMAGQLI